jgi:hypothetical protein
MLMSVSTLIWSDLIDSCVSLLQLVRRSIPQNKQRLCITENNFEKAKIEAQETWSDRLDSEFITTNNAKDFWNTFKKMTRKTEDKSVLPLMGDNNIPVFDSRNKTEMLREMFFGGKHLKHDSFFKNAGENFIKAMDKPFLGWIYKSVPLYIRYQPFKDYSLH